MTPDAIEPAMSISAATCSGQLDRLSIDPWSETLSNQRLANATGTSTTTSAAARRRRPGPTTNTTSIAAAKPISTPRDCERNARPAHSVPSPAPRPASRGERRHSARLRSGKKASR